MRPAVFLDRDGVLTEEVFYPATGEWEAALDPRDVVLRPGAAESLVRLGRQGFILVLVSNQAAHAKGKASLETLWQVHLRFVELLRQGGAALDDACYSFSHPDGVVPYFSGPSLERKPSPYLIKVAAARHGVALERSWMVGDRQTDVMAGQRAGLRAIRIANPHASDTAEAVVPTFRAPDLAAAVDFIVEQDGALRARP